jgi:hypothetical protein
MYNSIIHYQEGFDYLDNLKYEGVKVTPSVLGPKFGYNRAEQLEVFVEWKKFKQEENK